MEGLCGMVFKLKQNSEANIIYCYFYKYLRVKKMQFFLQIKGHLVRFPFIPTRNTNNADKHNIITTKIHTSFTNEHQSA